MHDQIGVPLLLIQNSNTSFFATLFALIHMSARHFIWSSLTYQFQQFYMSFCEFSIYLKTNMVDIYNNIGKQKKISNVYAEEN